MAKKEKAEDGGGAAVADGSLLDQVVLETKLAPEDESYQMTRRGLQAYIKSWLAPWLLSRQTHVTCNRPRGP